MILQAAHLVPLTTKLKLEMDCKDASYGNQLALSVNDEDNGLLHCPTYHNLFINSVQAKKAYILLFIVFK